MNLDRVFSSFASRTARITGSAPAFAGCVVVIAAWAATGPAFDFSQTWQLVINTGTTIVTFLMVFLIQNTQIRDGAALQTKLDELIRSSNAGDEFMGIEKLTDKELAELHEKCEAAAKRSHAALDRTRSERARRGHRGAPQEGAQPTESKA